MFNRLFSKPGYYFNYNQQRNFCKKNDLLENSIQKNLKVIQEGKWIGRISVKGKQKVVTIDKGKFLELNLPLWSIAKVLQYEDPVKTIEKALPFATVVKADIETVLRNSITYFDPKSTSAKSNSKTNSKTDPKTGSKTKFLSPHDISSMKAAGVVFVKSLLERVVEEGAKGDKEKANELRAELSKKIGKQLDQVKPGSQEALNLLKILTENYGISRHYLEVGLGPDAEIFTKSQPMSSIGYGSQLGINPNSNWNNPEPEIVLVVNRFGKIVGCTLGNDVNLRDWEGRSALLLGRAKDTNGSCVIGPMIRLFDKSFTLDDVRKATVSLTMRGLDGFHSHNICSMSEIGRDVTELVEQAMKTHQYPDGLFLMSGTMFAPDEDRNPEKEPGGGFTHKIGDEVVIESPQLGSLYNIVNYCNSIPPWSFGVVELMHQQVLIPPEQLIESGKFLVEGKPSLVTEKKRGKMKKKI